MSPKDVGLTVAGILASIAVAYLIYRAEQSNAQNSAIAQQNAEANAEEQNLQDAQDQYNLLSAIQSTSTGTTGETSTVTDTSSGQGSTSDAQDAGLITSIINDFTQSIAQPVAGQTNNASLIPTVNSLSDTNSVLSSVPTTASGALSGLNVTGAPGITVVSQTPVLTGAPGITVLQNGPLPVSTTGNVPVTNSGPKPILTMAMNGLLA